MNLFGAYRRKRAIKRYARELPRRLYKAYGASEFFTPAQVKTAVAKLGLDPALIALAYAMFLPEDIYEGSRSQLPTAPPYQEARDEFLRFAPKQPSAFN